ncbi:MAG: NHL repeat-containing protein, partial [Planctomycetota bacterium]
VVSAGEVQWGLVVGPDGYLYSFDGSTGMPETILKIDPAGTDSWTVYATFENSQLGDNRFKGWSWDGDGNFWVAMLGWKRNRRGSDLLSFVTSVPAGGTVAKSNRITESPGAVTDAMTTGPSGKIYVVETIVGESVQTVYEVAPDDSGGGGKGNGGGKGKNK